MKQFSRSGRMTDVDVGMEVDVAIKADEPRRVAKLLQRFGQENELSSKMLGRFELALDEVLTNVITHAFPDDAVEPSIRVALHLNDSRLKVRIVDNGPPFDPLQDAPAPDLSLSAEDRPVGGLGIHLARAFVHTLEYERVEGCNCLTLVQPLETQP